MADCTVVNKEGIYYVGGVGVDATTVTEDTIKIMGIICCAKASTDTIVVTTEAGTAQTILNWVGPISLSESFDMHGIRAKGVIVNHSSTGGKCVIVTE